VRNTTFWGHGGSKLSISRDFVSPTQRRGAQTDAHTHRGGGEDTDPGNFGRPGRAEGSNLHELRLQDVADLRANDSETLGTRLFLLIIAVQTDYGLERRRDGAKVGLR